MGFIFSPFLFPMRVPFLGLTHGVIIVGDGELRLKRRGGKSGFSSFTNGLYQTPSEPVLCPG
jgi:hypothetical protein